MDGNILIPIPGGAMVPWTMKNPGAIAEAIAKLNRFQNLRIDLIPATSNSRFPITPIDSPNGMTLGLPIQFGIGWEVPTGTVSRATFAVSTVTTAQLAARVAALIQDLQATRQAPTAG